MAEVIQPNMGTSNGKTNFINRLNKRQKIIYLITVVVLLVAAGCVYYFLGYRSKHTQAPVVNNNASSQPSPTPVDRITGTKAIIMSQITALEGNSVTVKDSDGVDYALTFNNETVFNRLVLVNNKIASGAAGTRDELQIGMTVETIRAAQDDTVVMFSYFVNQ